MINKINKNSKRVKRHVKIRHNLAGTTACPRLCVYRSLNHIYAQIIDDTKGVTLVACNTTQKDVAETLNISQSYISRLEKRIIKKLKAKVSK